jgi:lipoate-protein ligase A
MSLELKVYLFDQEAKSPSENLAINRYFRGLVNEGRYDLIARTYYHTNGVILGSNESIEDVHQNLCKKNGYEIVKRPSGGSAVVVSPELALCYTILFNATNLGLSKKIDKLYKTLTIPLARILGNEIKVEGAYYLRERRNGTSLPIAGHAMKVHSNGTYQFDGIAHRRRLNMSLISGLLKLRTLYSVEGIQYIRFDGETYNLNGSVSNIDLNGNSPIRNEEEELEKMIGLDELGISDTNFASSFYGMLSEVFGDVSEVEDLSKDNETVMRYQEIIKKETQGGKSGLGHCFVDFVEPEPRVHYG